METIQEFLVSLGYDLKESDVSAWERTVEKAKAAVLKAGAFLDRLERKAKEVFVETTVGLDHLNAMAGRAGTSVEEVRALAYALKQTGVNGGRAEDILETFASHLRQFPALTGVLNNLGVRTRENGRLRDNAEVFAETMAAIHKIEDYPTAARTADLFGISEDDYYNLRANKDQIEKDRQAKKDAYKRFGVNGKEAGISSMLIVIGWNRFTMTLDALLSKIAGALGPTINQIMDDLRVWLEKHQDKIVAICKALVKAISDLITELVKIIEDPSGSWKAFKKFLSDVAGGDGIVGAAERMGAEWAHDVTQKFSEAFDVAINAVQTIVDWLTGKKKLPQESVDEYWKRAQGGMSNSSPQKQGFFSKAKSFVRKMFGYGGGEGQSDGGGGSGDGGGSGGGAGYSQGQAPGDGRTPASIRTNNPGAQWPGTIAKEYGSTRHENLRDGQGNKIAIFDTKEQGAAAQFSLLRRKYTGKTLSSLIGIWSGGNSSAEYAASVAKRLGISPGTVITKEMLDDPDFAIALGKAMARIEAGREFPMDDEGWRRAHRMFLEHERSKQQAPPDAARKPEDKPIPVPDKQSLYAPPLGSSSHTFDLAANQETEIVVHGDPDPTRTTAEVASAQLRVNKGLTDQVERAA